MVLKRHLSEEDRFGYEEAPYQEAKRRITFETVVKDVMKGLSMQDFFSRLEPFLRKVVCEEVERVFSTFKQSSPRCLPNTNEAVGSRGWQLHFRNKLPSKLFTGNKIETEGKTCVQVVILDANSKRIITSGPLSSMKIEILVLDGDFGSDEKEDWTEEEFNRYVVRERDGKRPLVIGELQTTLKDGVGYFGDILFTDNSSWTRSRRFRLGARVIGSTSNEERIREARSGPFTVKDHRGELYRKHHPPALTDEVWRLEKIGKDGAFHKRLASQRIETVEDFLRSLVTDPSSLRNVFGGNMSARTWDIIVQHALSCTLDNKRYMYYNAERQIGLMFNSIYKVVGLTTDGQSYQSLDNLNSSQMILVESLKQHAYRNLNDMVEVDFALPPVDVPPLALPSAGSSFQGSNVDVHLTDFPMTHQDQSAVQVSLSSPTTALPFELEDDGHLLDVAVMQGRHLGQVFPPIQRNFKMRGSWTAYTNDGNQWVAGGSSGSVGLDGHPTGDEISQFQMQSWYPFTPSWGPGSGYFLPSDDENGINFPCLPDQSVCISRSCKSKMWWFKLKAAIKWVISVKRDLAARRVRFFQLDC